MSSLFFQHLNLFSLSTSFLYCNTNRATMSSFFSFNRFRRGLNEWMQYGMVLAAAFRGCVGMFVALRRGLGIVRGSWAARWAGKHFHSTSRFNLHLKNQYSEFFFFSFFYLVWFLQAAFGCVWGRGRGSAERIERANTTALNPDLIHIYFKQHFLPSFFQYILALLAL